MVNGIQEYDLEANGYSFSPELDTRVLECFETE